MAAFEGMLQEYLTCKFLRSRSESHLSAFCVRNTAEEFLSVERSEAARKDAEEQYVYDLYYRDIRDSSIIAARSDGAESSSIGAL